jgi:CheY-like chemotaxis protein
MSYTLLLADDSVTTHRLVELTFAEHGVRVVSVSDGEQAVERLKAEKPDIVLAEIGLGKVDGYELAEIITRTPRLAGVPVLLLMGAFDTLDEQRVRQSGAAGVVVKPFEPGLVIKRVKELLGFGGNDRPPASGPARMVTPAGPPPLRPPAGPRGVGPPPPPRDADIPVPPSAWDELRASSGLSADTAHVEGQATGDDYFDRLDAAFDSLDARLAGRSTQRPGARPAPRAPVAAAPAPPAASEDSMAEAPVYDVDRDWFNQPAPPVTPPPVGSAPAPAPAVAPAPPPSAPAAPAPVAPVASASARAEMHASYGETSPTRPAFESREGGPEHLTMVPASHVADAFASLLAAEQGEMPHAQAPVIEISDEVIDRIAARVAEHLTEGMLIDTVSHIVGAVTERLVKEEIARIRAAAPTKKPQ